MMLLGQLLLFAVFAVSEVNLLKVAHLHHWIGSMQLFCPTASSFL